MHPRYALYWAPPADGGLWSLGCAVLGRDAETGRPAPRPELPGFPPEEFAELTAEPRRYGLHATLKPPFRLAEGRPLADLEDAVAEFASERAPFALPPLAVATVGRFVALCPAAPCRALLDLAQDCVEDLDDFRAESLPEELDKRRAKGLTPRQDDLLVRWGYPYVAQEYRFHLTLTNSVADAGRRERLRAALDALFTARLSRELAEQTVRELCLFLQPGEKEPFLLYRRFPLGG